ncbi:MAG: 30S ribosomal protein S17 [Candidatus Altiarchaeota archaeon]|nr:30S ribosomal protein S17 [Candidatus Altiarchaeota archaeon]
MTAKKKKTERKVECSDINCPIHGQLPTRGVVLEGVVVSDKMSGTVIVQKNYFIKSAKYERYRTAKSRIPAHNPPCIDAKTGDNVQIEECRKLSKTVNFVVTKKI